MEKVLEEMADWMESAEFEEEERAAEAELSVFLAEFCE